MKIILLEDVKKQGKKGDVINVADGYGNFLINAHKAVIASQQGINRLNKEKEQHQKELELLLDKCKKIKSKLEKEELKFKVKTGVEDRVFGSISAKQIATELQNKGYEIDKKQIKITNPIATLGYHTVDVELHKKVVAQLKIQLIK